MMTRKYRHPRPPAESARGFSLVELMITMAIGLVLILGAVTIYASGRQNFRTFENIARIQDNGRFALSRLGPDVRLAGYWGRSYEAAFINVPDELSVTCDGADVTAWALALDEGIGAVDDGYDLPCPPFSAASPATDVLILRHASSRPATLQAGTLQVQTARTNGVMFDDGLMPAGFLPAPVSETHDVVVHAYYVDQSSSVGDLPSLRRQTLVAGNRIQDQEVIPGVENLQVQFGIDTDDDGTVDRYVDPDHAALTPGAAGFVPTAEITAVRLWLLVRSELRESAYVNDATYTPLDGDLAPITPGDSFRRMQLSTTIFLRNQ
jgi:type IV pilus assembly protein PilW